MPPRRRVPDAAGRAAITTWSANPASAQAADAAPTAVRWSLEELAQRHPGRSVEVRVPPYAAVQCIPGPVHRRGTPSNVVETDPTTWLEVATGKQTWDEAAGAGALRFSGTRADLTAFLPLVPQGD
ncbi:MAG: hypothetical protein KBB39_13230 [Phycicoccus sp.]|nr:hypothetical protein [Phycicoccus sp.]